MCIGCKAWEVACKEWNDVPEDGLLLTGSHDTLIFLTLICAIAMGIMGVLDAIRSAMLSRIGAWFERTLRFELLSGVLRVAFDRGNSFGQQLIGDL